MITGERPRIEFGGRKFGGGEAVAMRRHQGAIFVVVLISSLLGIGVRATYGAQVSADEPQYLLTAISLGEDLDLDISDELAEERFRDFHEVNLSQQTIDLTSDGQRISPHDPLLPIILAGPVLLGGWEAAKATLSVIAALTAVATFVLAVRRFDVTPRIAAVVTATFFVAAPFTAYGTQVYPAMPAALATVLGVYGVTGPLATRTSAIAVTSVVALPWLSVKYVPIAAVIGIAMLVRHWVGGDRRGFLLFGGVLGVAGVMYLAVHQRVWGGWTVYSAGDHFVTGEFEVVGTNPNYVARTNRLVGLLVDRFYGVAAWAPGFLLMPAGVLATYVHGPRKRWLPNADAFVVLSTIAAGWAVATWVALTMHGWWWSGRQIVPILPLVVVGISILVQRLPKLRVPVVLSGALGVLNWFWLAFETSTGRLALIVDHEETSNPIFQMWAQFLPDHRVDAFGDQLMTAGWGVLFALSVGATWRALRTTTSVSADFGADADGVVDQVQESSRDSALVSAGR